MRHRADIDGLRAIAVVPVVLFHAGVSQVSGGFVGVDIFFVISGYLITSLILGETSEGRFSLLSFYERRVRRIFPALFAVLAVCMVIAGILFIPADLKNFDRSLLAATFFVSNIYFYATSGYFAAPPDTQLLLHTWSLSIEEQFYVVFPLLLMIALRWGGRRWIWLICAAFVLSLAASIWVTAVNPEAAFYLAPTRVWELMLGALLAARILPGTDSQGVREVLAMLGIALIGYAVFSFDSLTPFPGSAALIPCLGAALILYAGADGRTSLVSKALSLWPLVSVGLISYSLYLWHWPLLVFGRYWNIVPLTATQAGVIVVASFVLAALSYAYIEQPFRRKRPAIPPRVLAASTATAMAIAVAFVAGTVSAGWPARFSPQVLALSNDAEASATQRARLRCASKATKGPCILGSGVTPTYAIWGDSHAMMMLSALAAYGEHEGIAFAAFVRAACPPVVDIDFRSGTTTKGCMARNTQALAALESAPEIGTVILMSRSTIYIKGLVDGETSPNPSGLTRVFGPDGKELDVNSRAALWERQFDGTVQRLLAAGKRVVLVYPVPEIGFAVPGALGRLVATGRDPASLPLPLAKFQQRQDIVISILDRAGVSPRILRVYPHKKLCNQGRCLIYANGKALYRDSNHLSRAGAEFVFSEFEPVFAPDRSPTAEATSALAVSDGSSQH